MKPDGNDLSTNDPVALIIVSDTHINSTVALCPPVVNLDDGGTYHSSKTQKWLWHCWNDFVSQARGITEGYRRVVVIGGDMVELDTKRRSVQLITMNKATILQMAFEALEPVLALAKPKDTYIIKGTSAHVGKSAWSEEEFGSDIDAAQTKDGNYSWWQLRATVAGVKVDIAHHASMGKIPWYRRLAAGRLASETMWNYAIEKGKPPPDLVIRAHNHTYATSGDNLRTEVNYLPCWSTMTEFGYRIGYENVESDIGGMVYLFEKGQYRKIKILYPYKEENIWSRKL